MKAINVRRATGLNVADRWRLQYYEEQPAKWPKMTSGTPEDIYNRLCDLGPNPDPEAVDAVIGNKSWTHPLCICCSQYVDKVASIGESEDSLSICEPCLEAALAEIKRA